MADENYRREQMRTHRLIEDGWRSWRTRLRESIYVRGVGELSVAPAPTVRAAGDEALQPLKTLAFRLETNLTPKGIEYTIVGYLSGERLVVEGPVVLIPTDPRDATPRTCVWCKQSSCAEFCAQADIECPARRVAPAG